MSRQFWVLFHRCAGLMIAGFLCTVGITGSLLAFFPELQRLTSPNLYGRLNCPPLDLGLLAERIEAKEPHVQVTSIWAYEPDSLQVNVAPRPDPISGHPHVLNFDQIVLDPCTGEELLKRNLGAVSEGLHNLMPLVLKLHHTLILGEIGRWILGVTALVWTFDCFVGFYLTLPINIKKDKTRSYRSFWQRWKLAWLIKWRASSTRVNFDLHRALGLWLWPALLVFAWSSVYMNLWDTVYTWIMRRMSNYHEYWFELPKLPIPLEHPKIGWSKAAQIGRALMTAAATTHGFAVDRVIGMRLNRELGVYIYYAHSNLDVAERYYGKTRVIFDADTGDLRLILLPTGQYTGNTISSWLAALHMATVFGLPYRIFVCFFGLGLAVISITGVLIWFKKRRARRNHI